MINDQIQELLDGGLGDDQAAELLHALSVSPERRADFLRHLGLRQAIASDRQASALQPEEDSAIWGAIASATGSAPAAVGGGALAAASGAAATGAAAGATRPLLGRILMVAAAGVAGWLLGNATGTHESSQQVAVPIVNVTPLLKVESAPIPAEPRLVYRDRTLYRDRVVFRDRPAPVEAPLLASDRTEPSSSRRGALRDGQLPVEQLTLARPNELSPNAALRDGEGGGREGAAELRGNETSTPVTPLDSQATRPAERRSAANLPEGITDTSGASLRRGGGELPPAAPSVASLFEEGGIELAYSERLGRLAATPASHGGGSGYSARYLDLSYRFGGGAYGLGMRFGQGTFASVSLVGDQTVRREGPFSRIDTIYRPQLSQSNETTVEFFANYRLPLFDRFAIGSEVAYNLSTTHQRLGADLFGLWFATDRLGLQAGVGLSRYWYSLADERERLMQQGENVGISDDVLQEYNGAAIEGRYGILYRF